jgi:hypothetical protein
MIRCDETTVGYDLAEAASGKSEVTFSDGVCQQRVVEFTQRIGGECRWPKSWAMAG